MEEKQLCNFCRKNEMVGCYATDHGPFSLFYCNECLKHRNIRTIFNALSKYARFGDDAFSEYIDSNGCEPNVYFNGNYISLRTLVEIINIEVVEKHLDKTSHIYSLLIERLKL